MSDVEEVVPCGGGAAGDDGGGGARQEHSVPVPDVGAALVVAGRTFTTSACSNDHD